MCRGKTVLLDHAEAAGDPQEQPHIMRTPEIIHGLRNLVQNAVDFADDVVWVENNWTETQISVRIMDNGPGFPTDLLGRIGDPFVRRRAPNAQDAARPAYEGMGLGLFIAKTLLERSGAVLRFANGPEGDTRTGAVIEVIWPRDKLETPLTSGRRALAQNERITS
jgi:two-component system sensor histidine kinase RegB